jgi:hypothetical protein
MIGHRIAGALVAVIAIAACRVAHGAPQRPVSLLDTPGYLAAYGQRERTCEEPLAMSLPAKGPAGDYSMCCKEFYEPLALSPDDLVEVVVRLSEPEERLQIKLEENGPVQLLVRDGPADAGVVSYRRAFSRAEPEPWQIKKICVVAGGRVSRNHIEIASARVVERAVVGPLLLPAPTQPVVTPVVAASVIGLLPVVTASVIGLLGAVALVTVRHRRRRSATEARPRRLPRAIGATRDHLLTRLSRLSPSQFEEVLFRANVPPAHLPSVTAPQTTRAIDAIRYLEQQRQLVRLARTLDEVAASPS